MSYTGKRMAQQRAKYLYGSIMGGVLAGIGVAAIPGALREGMGNNTGGNYSAGNILRKAVDVLITRYPALKQWEPYAMAAVFAILAIIGIVYLLKGLWQMSASRTLFGKFVMTQLRDGEKLKQALAEINADLQIETRTYEIFLLGRKWALGEEAMRLDRVAGIFALNNEKKGLALALVDVDQNQMLTVFKKEETMMEAANAVHRILPDAIYGGNEEYLKLTDPNYEPIVAQRPDGSLRLKHESSIHYVGVEGIPTSKHTLAEIQGAVKNLKQGEDIHLMLGKPVSVSKHREVNGLSVTAMGQDQYVVAMLIEEYVGPYQLFNAMNGMDVLQCIQEFYEEGLFPDFTDWERREGQEE